MLCTAAKSAWPWQLQSPVLTGPTGLENGRHTGRPKKASITQVKRSVNGQKPSSYMSFFRQNPTAPDVCKKGVIGDSALYDLEGFDVVWHVGIDVFHLCYVGVTKLLLKRMFVARSTVESRQLLQEINQHTTEPCVSSRRLPGQHGPCRSRCSRGTSWQSSPDLSCPSLHSG